MKIHQRKRLVVLKYYPNAKIEKIGHWYCVIDDGNIIGQEKAAGPAWSNAYNRYFKD